VHRKKRMNIPATFYLLPKTYMPQSSRNVYQKNKMDIHSYRHTSSKKITGM